MAGLPPVEIAGCDPGCRHEWGEELKHPGGSGGPSEKQSSNAGSRFDASQGQYCQLCGGWRGCLGLEPTPEMFVGHIVLIWRELWRVMRDDAVCFLNLGDSYFGGKQKSGEGEPRKDHSGGFGGRFLGTYDQQTLNRQRRTVGDAPGLKPKDLIGIPWRVAFALQADGWYLRSDLIWAKGLSFCPTYSGSCMPESVRDRPTKAHEFVFLLAKSERYYYDIDAVREAHTTADRFANREPNFAPHQWIKGNTFGNNNRAGGNGVGFHSAGRNLRSVWAISPGNYSGAHFATFPSSLVEPMIKAGTSERGCCPECGKAWERVTEKTGKTPRDMMKELGPSKVAQTPDRPATISANQGLNFAGAHGNGMRQITTTGWRPACTCNAGDPIPCTVLDPFGGSGTVAEVATKLRRRWILIELSQVYCDEHIIPRLDQPLQMELAM